ncbi:MAG: hypothetical protein ACREO1_15290 [Arenimonas sp.]
MKTNRMLYLILIAAGLFQMVATPAAFAAKHDKVKIAYLSARDHETRATFWTIGSLILILMTVWTLVVALGF